VSSEQAGDVTSDYYALMGLPVSLSLESKTVDEAWRTKTRVVHPDLKADGTSGDETTENAAGLNEARRILSDPLLRLEHWLDLKIAGFPRATAIDEDLLCLFSEVNAALARADDLIQKRAATTTELGKAVLAGDAVSAQLAVQDLLGSLRKKSAEIVDQFSAFEAAGDRGDYDPGVRALGRLTFLKKWEREGQKRLLDLIAIA